MSLGTRSFSNVPLRALQQRLSKSGFESVQPELKLMREEISVRRASSDVPSERNEMEWELGELEKMVQRRLKGEPLQYILGNQPFGPIAIRTRAPILIPRPETEDWTIRLTSLLEDRFSTKDGGEGRIVRMLDLCTGTGCIPILVCHLRREIGGITIAYGVDISTDAISLARENASDQSLTPSSSLACPGTQNSDLEAGAGVEVMDEFGGRTGQYRGTVEPTGTNVAGDARRSTLDVMGADILEEDFVQSVLSRMDPPFDVITSNPPYVPFDGYDQLPDCVKEWEDPKAILGDLPTPGSEDASETGRGLSFYRRIVEIVSVDGILGDNGVVALEVGDDQAEEVLEILKGCGKVSTTEVWKDPKGLSRVVVGYR